jgi:hypothetical protein
MEIMQTHLQILRRAGTVLIVFGMIALAAELDGVMRAPRGFVHLNLSWIGFLTAGLLLVRGKLAAAALIAWLPFCFPCSPFGQR